MGKTMKQWLKFSVAFWHSIRNDGADPFGAPTKRWPWDDVTTCGASTHGGNASTSSSDMCVAKRRMRALFELMRKLGVNRWCFHDRDIAPQGKDLAETNANLDEITAYGGDTRAQCKSSAPSVL
jgi:xylose isomerase